MENLTLVIHPTYITICSFWRTMFSSKVLEIIGKGYILTVKNNDNWTFLIFFVFTIVFPLEAKTRLYYLSITITTDTLPAQIGCRSPQISVFSPNAEKYGPEKTPYLDTFQKLAGLNFEIQLMKFYSWTVKIPVKEPINPFHITDLFWYPLKTWGIKRSQWHKIR